MTDWDGLSETRKFIGLDNFTRFFNDPAMSGATVHTFVIALTVMVIQNVIGLLLALAVNSRIKSRLVLRVFLFAPVVVIPIATSYTWRFILSPAGPLTGGLSALGVANPPEFLGDPTWALVSVCTVVIWQFTGFSMVIFLANLQSIPEDAIEASYVDGAGPFRRFWSIVRPELAPALTINLMLSIIGGFKLFDQVWALTNGGPGDATQTITTELYQTTFRFNEFGYGAAIGVVLTVIVAVISGAQFLALRRQNRG